MDFYKILNENECHRGFQYGTGLNVDPVPFQRAHSVRGQFARLDPIPLWAGGRVGRGIHFAREDILAFLSYGPWIRKVTLPSDAQWEKDLGSIEKWRADRVILGEREKITPAVIERLVKEGANTNAKRGEALKWASFQGHLKIIKILMEHRTPLKSEEEDDGVHQALIYGKREAREVIKEYLGWPDW